MHFAYRFRPWRSLLWLALMVSPAWPVLPAQALSISGIMVYSTDDFGNPSGVNTAIQGQFDAHLWRTLLRGGDIWHVLGVAEGLQSRGVDGPFLNFPDLTIDLPLDEGENYFTLFGEPGPLTATDDYQRFSINLYFDGDETKPGITVLIPRVADPDGSSVAESRANDDEVYALTLQKSGVPPQGYYDDGAYRVSVLRASFLPPERANLSVDRMTPKGFAASGTSDWVGSLVVMVEPSTAFGPGGAPPVPVAGGGGGSGTGSRSSGVAPSAGGPGYVPPGPLGGPAVVGQQPQRDYEDESPQDGGGAAKEFWHQGDKRAAEETPAIGTPTPADLVNALQEWLAKAATQTPGGDGENSAETTETPGPTRLAATPTPKAKTPGGDQTRTPDKSSTPTPASTASLSPTMAGTPTSAATNPPKPAAP
jgi:hypothetical protein